jgi:hypothetical protein
MGYKEGDIVLLVANIVAIDDEDDTLQIELQGSPMWITETCIVANPKPKFIQGELTSIPNDVGLFEVDQISYSPRQKVFQYKVDGHWYDEDELGKGE